MSEKEIINKVEQSGIVTIDLEDFRVPGDRVLFDLKDWLFEGMILKEKDFRLHVTQHNWNQYAGKYVAVCCTADAIVPTWAYMLVSSQLAPYVKRSVFGSLSDLEEELFRSRLQTVNPETFSGQRVVVKGCSDKDVPPSIYFELTSLLRPYVKSLMYGEACSAVPVYKRKTES